MTIRIWFKTGDRQTFKDTIRLEKDETELVLHRPKLKLIHHFLNFTIEKVESI